MSQIMTRFLSKRKPVLDASSRPPASQSTSTQVQSQAADAEDSLFVTPSTSFSSIVIDDDDDGPTAASVSSTPSSCPPTPSVSSARSRSGRAVFAIDFNNIWVLNKKCSGVHLRPPHCRTVTREVSWIWQHGVELSCDQYEKLFVCKICHLSKAYSRGVYIASSTNGAACHLTAAHGLEALASSKRSSPPQGYCNKCGNREDQSIDALIYRQVVVDWVIVHNLSFEMAVARDTLNLLGLSAYLRNALPTSATTLSTYVHESFNLRRPRISEAILLAKCKINLTFDGWKGPNHNNYVGIVAHFLDEDYERVNIVIGLPRIIGTKTGANEAKVICPVLEQHRITADNIGATTSDNAGDNSSAVAAIARILGLPEEWSTEARLRCIAHIAGLVIKALLFGIKESKINRDLEHSGADEAFEVWKQLGPVGKLHNICTWMNRNDERRQVFRDCQSGKNGVDDLPVLNLIQDGGIRWHSTHDMMERGKSKIAMSWHKFTHTNYSN